MITMIAATAAFQLTWWAHAKDERGSAHSWVTALLVAGVAACVAELSSGHPEFLVFAFGAAVVVTLLVRHLARQDERRWGPAPR